MPCGTLLAAARPDLTVQLQHHTSQSASVCYCLWHLGCSLASTRLLSAAERTRTAHCCTLLAAVHPPERAGCECSMLSVSLTFQPSLLPTSVLLLKGNELLLCTF